MIPTTAPSSTEALALYHLGLAIRDSTSFQSWSQAPTAAVAARYVHIGSAPKAPRRPFALIAVGQLNHRQIADGGVNVLDDEGMIGLLFEADTPDRHTDDAGAAQFWFLDKIGAVMADVRSVAGLAGYLNITRLQTAGPVRSDEAEEPVNGDYWQIVYQVEWR